MNEDIFRKFIEDSYTLMENYEKRGRYFHILSKTDNSPVVLHLKTNQLTYIIEGTGFAYLNDDVIKVEKGDFVYVPQNTKHRFIANECGLTLFHIHLPDEGRDVDRYVISGDDYNRYEE